LFVETGAEGWTATVSRHGHPLHTARRSSLNAAKTAAVEFSIFSLAGAAFQESPESVAKHLRWSEYW